MASSCYTIPLEALFEFMNQRLTLSGDLHVGGCNGTLRNIADWFEDQGIDPDDGLTGLKYSGAQCTCDCEIFLHLHSKFEK